MSEVHAALRALARRRWRVALVLTTLMVLTYFGFILLIAYDKPFMARLLTPGLSVGIVFGALVIGAAWALTLVYVTWANRVYDRELARIQEPVAR